MQKDKVMAQWCLEEQRRQQQHLATFNNLRPTWKSWVARLLSNLLVVLILQAMYPEVLSEPVLYVLVILIFAQGFDMCTINTSALINVSMRCIHCCRTRTKLYIGNLMLH